jgi:hypothetical protein
MYKEQELFEKVNGHIKEGEVKLLHSLVEEVDELNEKYVDSKFEVYIDFDNIGNGGGEFDPYETFSARIRYKLDDKIRFDTNIHSELSIHQLDDCLCMLHSYFEELEDCYKKLGEVDSQTQNY